MWEMFFSNIDFFLLHERKEEKQTTKTKELLPNKSYTPSICSKRNKNLRRWFF
jgi:hypothetical protein